MTVSEQTAKRLFFFALVFSPLAFGTVEPWSCAVMETAAAGALFVYMALAVKHTRPLPEVPGFFFLALMLGWVLFQLAPLPAAVVRLLSPEAFEIHQNAVFAGKSSLWMTLSLHPSETAARFLRYAAYAGVYILTIQLLADRDRLRQAVVLVTVFGALLSFSSILQLYLTEDRALWFRLVQHGSIMGPYINRNHYAGLMGMILPVVLGLFLFFRPRLGNSNLFKSVVEILSQEKANLHILVGSAAVLIATSIVLSLSRGGMISTCLALLVFTALLARRRISRSGTLITASFVLLACLSVSWFGWEPIFERFRSLRIEQMLAKVSRISYWQDSIEIISEFPVTGAGYGTFKDIYPAYQSIGENHYATHAHNDYLELLVEGGGVGFLLFAGFFLTWLAKSCRAFKTRRDPYAILIYIGCVSGTSAIVFHSFADFNMQIGANGLWFFFLLGLAVSAANTRMQLPKPATRLPDRGGAATRGLGLGLSAFFLAGVLVFSGSSVLGDLYYSSIQDYEMRLDTPAKDLEKIRSMALRALRFDPWEAPCAYTAADAAWLLGEREAAEAEFLRAIRLNPVKSHYYKRYGVFLAQAGKTERAERMLELAVRYAPVRSDTALEYGALLFLRGKKEEGLRQLKRAVSLNPDTISQALGAMAVSGVSVDEMRQAVPDIPDAAVAFGRFLQSTGEPEAAEMSYRHALSLMEAGKAAKCRHVFRIYRFFERQGRIQEAMDVLQRAEALFPRDAGIRIRLGDLYREQGIYYKAREKYEAALLIDPDNRAAQSRLQN